MNRFENRNLAGDSVLVGIGLVGDHIVSKGVF